MTATATMIARVRRMVAEPTTKTYADLDIQAFIESYPLIDLRGEEPFSWDLSTTPPTQDENENWVVTYDLNAAAADILEEKAAVYVGDFDFRVDGGDYKRSQAYQNLISLAQKYRAKRAHRTIEQYAYPPSTSSGLAINVNDPYE